MLTHMQTVYHRLERRPGHCPGGEWPNCQAWGAGVGEAKMKAVTKSRRLEQVDPGKLTEAILPMSSAP